MCYIYGQMINCLLIVVIWLVLFQVFWQVPMMSIPPEPIQRMSEIPELALICVNRLPNTKHNRFLKKCLSEFDVVHVPNGRLTLYKKTISAFVMPKVYKNRIYLTPIYEQSSKTYKILTLLHECYHLYSRKIKDIAYRFESHYDTLSEYEKSINADSLAWKTLNDCLN